MSPSLLVVILTLLLGLQPVATDLYLPALPVLTDELHAPMTQAQRTLTALLLAFGASQLAWGPLSDRFGRRPILLWGAAAYTLASVGSIFSSSMDMLVAWRTLQGVAMGATGVCARAIVRDLFDPVTGARFLSKGSSGLGAIACMCAPLGGLLSDLFGWRAALLAVAVFGAAVLALLAARFEETVATPNPQALRPDILLRTWAGILGNATFWSFSLLSAVSYCGLFTFLATSSFVFIKLLGLSKTQYGLLLFSMSFFYILGTLGCRRLLSRFGVRRAVAVAGGFSLTGGILIAGLAFAGVLNVWALILPFYLFILAHGVHQPCGQSGAVAPFPHAAGAAAALSGFFMMTAAFLMGGWLGTHMDGSVFPLAYGIGFWGMATALVAWTLVQRNGGGGEQAPV